MKKNTRKTEKDTELHSFEEYRKKFFPDAADQKVTEVDAPRSIGINIARRVLRKIRK